jgi:O-antigen/teichoic acid export membrane protein
VRLGRNLLAGLANSIWTAIVGLAVVPFYLKYLGIEAYGLIGFFATIQVLLSLLDLGLAPTINREVARCSASGNMLEARNLLHTLAVVYWVTAGIIALFIVALAPFISNHWLQSSHISPDILARAIMLMGLVVACRWPIGLYLGALMGMQRLTVSSSVNIVMTTIGSFGAVAILAFVSPTIEAFVIWQAGVALLYAVTMRWAAWDVIGREGVGRFDVNGLKRIWRFSVGMSGVALSAILLSQLDKVILSRMLGLAEFGQYMLATTVVSGLYFLITPVFNAVYPRFSTLVVGGNTEKLADLYRLGTRLLATVLFPIAMALAVFAEDLVHVWTGNSTIATNVAPIISLLAIGSALHGMMYFPYALQLSYGMTRLPLTINAILMIVLVPLIIFLTLSYGALGGAMAWLAFHVLYVILGTWLTHRRLLKGIGGKWLLLDVGIPLVISLLVGLVGHYTIQGVAYSAYVKLIYGGALALLALLLSLAVSPKLRAVVLNSLGWNKRGNVLITGK